MGIKTCRSFTVPLKGIKAHTRLYVVDTAEPVNAEMTGNCLKVRKHAPGYEDPGYYRFPEGSTARKATPQELERDNITLPETMPGPEPKQHSHGVPKNPHSDKEIQTHTDTTSPHGGH